MSDPPATPEPSRVRRILLGLAVLFGLPLLVVFLISFSFVGVPGLDGVTDRYRTEVQVVVDDNGHEVRNAVLGECGRFRRSNWNTSVQHGASHNGDAPFVVLRDRSLLMLTALSQCLPSDGPGPAYTFDANLPLLSDSVVGDRIRMPSSRAWHFDNVDAPQSTRLYHQPELFCGRIDGLRVIDAKLSFAGRSSAELPFAGEDAFPWLKTVPWHPVGHEDYGKDLYLSTFSGFEVKLYQLVEKLRCEKFDREADGPILVVGDVWDTCPPWGSGGDLGWLTAQPNADFSRIDYSYDRHSPHHIATLHRTGWLQQKGARGVRDENDFYWQPVICVDGFCATTHAARRVVWEGFRLYYPRKNQVISVRWQSPAVSGTFRRRDNPS
jgi:hypothetical protein